MQRLLVLFLVGLTVVLATSCGGKSPERPAPVLTPEQIQQANQQQQAPIVPTGAPASTVYHYQCPQGHEGGDAAGTCSQCGLAYEHNQAWHNQAVQQVNQPAAEPAQNAAGVWHYTCPNGHAGGAGSATACGECGATLVHNAAYHN